MLLLNTDRDERVRDRPRRSHRATADRGVCAGSQISEVRSARRKRARRARLRLERLRRPSASAAPRRRHGRARSASACAASSSSSSSDGQRIALDAERPCDQPVAQPGVLRQQRPVDVGPDHVAGARALQAAARRRCRARAGRGRAAPVRRPGECGRRGFRSRRSRRPSTLAHAMLPISRGPVAANGAHIEQSDSRDRAPRRSRRSARAAGSRRRRRARRRRAPRRHAVPPPCARRRSRRSGAGRRPGRRRCSRGRARLAARSPSVLACRRQLDSAPGAATLEHQQVAAVGVDVHQLGVERADAQRLQSSAASEEHDLAAGVLVGRRDRRWLPSGTKPAASRLARERRAVAVAPARITSTRMRVAVASMPRAAALEHDRADALRAAPSACSRSARRRARTVSASSSSSNGSTPSPSSATASTPPGASALARATQERGAVGEQMDRLHRHDRTARPAQSSVKPQASAQSTSTRKSAARAAQLGGERRVALERDHAMPARAQARARRGRCRRRCRARRRRCAPRAHARAARSAG